MRPGPLPPCSNTRPPMALYTTTPSSALGRTPSRLSCAWRLICSPCVCCGPPGNLGPMRPSAARSALACRWDTGVRTPPFWRRDPSSSGRCPGASLASQRTSAVSPPCAWPCKPANSTSDENGLRATSARPRSCPPWSRACTRSITDRTGCGAWPVASIAKRGHLPAGWRKPATESSTTSTSTPCALTWERGQTSCWFRRGLRG